MPRKRTHSEMATTSLEESKPEPPSLLTRIRNMWEFASVMQYIFMFGKMVKIDEDFDIEDFENECLKPGYSEKLEDINLQLLKWISSHRGLDHANRDEYTRRQYQAKAPDRNIYGDDEEPRRFRDFDIFTKIRVLHQLTIWTFWNPDRIRQAMPDQQNEREQTEWRVEEFGYDRDDRQYYLLDDNRLYRRTEPPLPPLPKAKPKQNSLKAIAARRRASKRRRIIDSETPDTESQDGDAAEKIDDGEGQPVDGSIVDTFGGYKWECLCITLQEYTDFVGSLAKTKDPNEKLLRERLQEEVIPIIEAAVEKQRRKIERRERELMMMERMVGAKRSSRLADKHDKERREQEIAEAERKRKVDLEAAMREQERQEKMEHERQYRMMTREQRIKDREFKRILAEEELARDAEEQKLIEEGAARGSERDVKRRIERKKKELQELEEDEEWTFDCSGCGIHGKNLDDGSHSIACEKCNVWQHSKCLGIAKSAAEKDDFSFVCKDCKRKEAEKNRPKISLKFKVGGSSSPAPPSPAPHTQTFAGVIVSPTGNARPPSQGAMNGVLQQASPTRLPVPTAGRRYQQSPPVRPLVFPTSPRAQGQHMFPGQHQFPVRPSASPPQNTYINGYARPPSSGGQQQYVHQQSPARYPPSYNGQYPHIAPSPQPIAPLPIAPRPSALPLSQTPREPPNGQFSSPTQFPSPILNRPTMSPTQGNMDVSSVAGISQKATAPQDPSPSLSNGVYPLATPRQPSQGPSAATPMSGLSPTKQRTPIPGPLGVPSQPVTKSVSPPMTKSPLLNARSVSGTPIIPPVENLRPSPELMKTEPVPTPSKQVAPQPMSYAAAGGTNGSASHQNFVRNGGEGMKE